MFTTFARDVKNNQERRKVSSCIIYLGLCDISGLYHWQLHSGNVSVEEELMMACHFGDFDKLCELRSTKIDLNIPNEHGWTTVHGACRYSM